MSGWCHAASARWPTVLITISVPFQLCVLYLRRIQPFSYAIAAGPSQPLGDFVVRVGLFFCLGHGVLTLLVCARGSELTTLLRLPCGESGIMRVFTKLRYCTRVHRRGA